MILFDLLLCHYQAAHFLFIFFLKSFNKSFFCKVLTKDSNGLLDINSSVTVLSFFWFKVEADVEVDESCARILPFRSLCLKLSA